jgi:hypothetical protein
MSFGANLKTLDDFAPSEKRADRVVEYQYRFIKIVDETDPIFEGVANAESGVWQITPCRTTSCACGKITVCRSKAFPLTSNF